jgi:hypothetical protein
MKIATATRAHCREAATEGAAARAVSETTFLANCEETGAGFLQNEERGINAPFDTAGLKTLIVERFI